MGALRWLLPVLALIAATPAFAVQPDEMLANPVLEARARAISQELRCMVCQNESIDNSQAPLARDIRLLVRERLKAGDSDKQVVDYLVGRYGAFVLLKPPFEWNTVLLWLLSPLLLIVGGLSLWYARRRAARAATAAGVATAAPLTDAEQHRLERLLNLDGPPPIARG